VLLGHGDPNLAKYLPDGTGVRIVDFEDCGPSYRAFELALLVEHISAWPDTGLKAPACWGCLISPPPTRPCSANSGGSPHPTVTQAMYLGGGSPAGPFRSRWAGTGWPAGDRPAAHRGLVPVAGPPRRQPDADP